MRLKEMASHLPHSCCLPSLPVKRSYGLGQFYQQE